MKNNPSKSDKGDNVRDTETVVEDTDDRRREIVNMLKKAAIAGPVLLTLKSTPARAASGGSAVSGGSAGVGGIIDDQGQNDDNQN
jgi:hypothetical protein